VGCSRSIGRLVMPRVQVRPESTWPSRWDGEAFHRDCPLFRVIISGVRPQTNTFFSAGNTCANCHAAAEPTQRCDAGVPSRCVQRWGLQPYFDRPIAALSFNCPLTHHHARNAQISGHIVTQKINTSIYADFWTWKRSEFDGNICLIVLLATAAGYRVWPYVALWCR
jgi:hypothetical protein